MVIALLVVLGIPIWFVFVLAGVMIIRHRWLSSRPGCFTCAARMTSGTTDLLGAKWKRGVGRWERDVFVFAKVPSVYSFTTVAVDELDASSVRRAGEGEVRRLGDAPLVYPFVAASAVAFEIVFKPEDATLAAGPFPAPPAPAGAAISSDTAAMTDAATAP